MARRTKDEAEETRERIVEAAIRMFLRDGVSRTTLEGIAAQAGFTRGAVYHHFGNKGALLRELLSRVRPPAETILDVMSGSSGNDKLEALQIAVGASLKRILEDENASAIHTVFLHNCEFVERMNPMIGAEAPYFEATLETVTKVLLQAQEQGSMRRDLVAQEVAGVLMSFGYGLLAMALRKRMEGDTFPLGPWDRTMEPYFKGLRA